MLLEIETSARSLARKLGLVPVLHRFRRLWRTGYEESFSHALLSEIRLNDCVWDVGANVGYYSRQIAPIAARVIAFEPLPEAFLKLSQLDHANLTLVSLALGDREGTQPLAVSGTSSSLAVPVGTVIDVHVARGDDLDLPQPNIVKIDVEGYEPEVIAGMQARLRSCECRAAFCELHFQTLEKRGIRQGPAVVIRQLRSLGFTRIRWLDASHIGAYKSTSAVSHHA